MDAYESPVVKQLRLDNSIAMFQGDPVYVTTRTDRYDTAPLGEFQVKIGRLNDKDNARFVPGTGNRRKYDRVDYTEPSFQPRGIKMGYFWAEKETGRTRGYFVARAPTRTTQEGPSSYNLIFFNAAGHASQEPRLIDSMDMYNCIKGIHPDVKYAMKNTTIGNDVPFDREYSIGCIDRGILSLKYRGELLGLSMKKGQPFMIHNKKLAILLEDDLTRLGVPYEYQ